MYFDVTIYIVYIQCTNLQCIVSEPHYKANEGLIKKIEPRASNVNFLRKLCIRIEELTILDKQLTANYK